MAYNGIWLVCLLILHVLDVATTFVGLRLGLQEANGIARWLNGALGEWAMYGWKALLIGIFLSLLFLLRRHEQPVWLAVRFSVVVLLLVVSLNLFNLALVEGIG